MIFMASHLDRIAFHGFTDPTQIIKKVILDRFINIASAMFGAKYKVSVDF